MFLKRLMVEEEGQGLVEYTLILGVLVVAIWLAIQFTGIVDLTRTLWTNVATQLAPVGGAGGAG